MDHFVPQAELGRETAVIVPVYFSARPSDAMVDRLLWMTVVDLPPYVPAEQVWLVVDGDSRSAAIARQVLDRLATAGQGHMRLLVNEENAGKLAVIRQGMRVILESQPHVRYLAIMDGDGDHLPAVLPGLIRAADSMVAAYGHERVIAIGARSSRTRPMGWVRGELEGLVDQLTIDALTYALARDGRAIDLSQCLPGRIPDLSSGYKVYLREMALLLFGGAEPETGTLSAWDYWHYGPETVTIVDAMQAGAVFGEMLRPSWDGQPATSFGEFSVVSMYGALLTWVWARLGLSLEVAATQFDNRRVGMALGTAIEGAEELDRLRTHALGGLATHTGQRSVPPARATLPFV
ncbi:MAG: glycosyltransferase [Anaerolineae bacterium]